MAKQRTPKTQEIQIASPSQMERMDFGSFREIMISETAGLLSDNIRQYIGVVSKTPTPGSGIIRNLDRILNTQTYQEMAWYDLYDELEKDPQINSALTSAKLNVAGLEYSVVPYTERGVKKTTARHQEIADFVMSNLEGMENFPQDLFEMMSSLGKGFSASEVIWEVGYETRVKKLMNRPQRRFQFDAYTREPKLRTLSNPFYGDPLDPYKFIIHRVSSQYENPFGDALDQSLYWIWLFKRMVTKFWVTNLETATAPVPIVQYPSGGSTDIRADALAVARQIRSGAYGAIPENMAVMWAEAQNMMASNVSYESFLHYCDEQALQCINGQTLTSQASGTGGAGSRALGSVHQITQNQRDVFRAKSLAATLNSTLIKWIVDFNFSIGENEGYPRFKFNVEEQVDRLQEMTIIKTAKEAGWDVDEQYMNDTFQIPFTKSEVPMKPDNFGNNDPNNPDQQKEFAERKKYISEKLRAKSEKKIKTSVSKYLKSQQK